MELLTDPQAWIAFFTLTALELVLGIDNIIFISILVDRLPPEQRELARRIGLGLAMFMRIGLLLVALWIVGLTAPLFTVLGHDISGRDLILHRRRLVPALEGDRRDPRQLMEGEAGEASCKVRATFGGSHRADHHHRPRVLARLHHHRRRHGGRDPRDGRRGGRLGRRS